MVDKELRQELVKVITGYQDCNDCDVCQFKNCCYEKEIAEQLLREGWRKVGPNLNKRPNIDVKIGCIMQSYNS